MFNNFVDFVDEGSIVVVNDTKVRKARVYGIAPTGGQAKLMVENSQVMVDGVVELRKRRKVRSGMTVTTIDGYSIKVS